MLEWIREGKVGMWRVEHFEITREQATMYAISCYGSYEIPPRAGRYTRLCHDQRGVVMSDTRQELWDLYTFNSLLDSARSYDDSHNNVVHINGLGLGIFSKAALDKAYCVQVVEIDSDVIDLVGSQLRSMYGDRITIINGDALEWRPRRGARYAVAWHDIWDVVSYDNYEEYKLLRRRWGHYAFAQGVWADWWMKKIVRDERGWQ